MDLLVPIKLPETLSCTSNTAGLPRSHLTHGFCLTVRADPQPPAAMKCIDPTHTNKLGTDTGQTEGVTSGDITRFPNSM